MKKIQLNIFLFINAFLSLICVAEDIAPKITVSCNVPLTGELSVYGSAIEEGVRFFQESLPETKGSQVKFNWQDNEGKGSRTLTIAKSQLASKPTMYVSGVKPQYMVIEEVLKNYPKMPNFAWVFDSFLREKNQNNFRTWVDFKSEAGLFLDHISKKKGLKKVAIIYVITPTVVQQQNSIIIPGLDKLGLTDHLVIPYQMDQLDFKAIALKTKSFKPDFIFLSGFQHNMPPLIKAFRNLSLIENGNTVATYDMLDALSLLRPDETEGIKFTMPKFLLSRDEKFTSWKNKFRDRFKKEPLYTHMYAHEMAEIIYDVAERYSNNPDKSIIDLLASTKVDGIIGKLQFDNNGDIQTEVCYGATKNGVLINAGDY